MTLEEVWKYEKMVYGSTELFECYNIMNDPNSSDFERGVACSKLDKYVKDIYNYVNSEKT